MSYQVLARKWRPRHFREMVGQEHVLRALINALDNDRLHHAYLFTGTRGVGKTTIARILAKCLNCDLGVSSQPCGECGSCLEIAEGRSVDLLEVDAASRTKVEDTRELLDNVQYAPTRSRYKVYLIDEVHMLSTHSFNALLKTLEEPPPHVKFLLATTDPQKLPATVLSRCLQFNLKNMPPEQVVGHLQTVLTQEQIKFEDPALWLLGRAAAGSMRDALSLTDQAIAFGSGTVLEDDVRSMLGSVDLSFVYRVLQTVAAGEPAAALQVVAQMSEHAPDFEGSLDELISLIHRVAVAQAVPDAIDNNWGDAETVAAIAASLTAEDAQLYYQIALNGKRDIALALDPRSGFEMILLRMIAFRPEAVIDPGLDTENLREVLPAVALEGDPVVKKSPESSGPAQAAQVMAKPQPQSQPQPQLQSQPQPEPQPQPRHRQPQPQPTAAPAAVDRPPPQPVATALTQPAATPRAVVPSSMAEPGSGIAQPESGPVPEQAAIAPVKLTELTPGSWLQLMRSLGLRGAVENIAANCELRRVEGTSLELVLDQRASSLFNSDRHPGLICKALENYFGQSLSVSLVAGDITGVTPAQEQARQQRERQLQAVTEIEHDPRLQHFIQRFDGELDRESIVPLDV